MNEASTGEAGGVPEVVPERAAGLEAQAARDGTAEATVNEAAGGARGAEMDLLARQIDATRRGALDELGALEALVRERSQGAPDEAAAAVEYLTCTCAGVRCLVSLATLREVTQPVPAAVSLPFSPAWLVGIFPLRAEMVGLVDPAILLGRAANDGDGWDAEAGRSGALIAGDEQPLALLVRDIGSIVALAEADILTAEGTPAPAHGLPSHAIVGYAAAGERDEPLPIFDVAALAGDALAALLETRKGRARE